MRILVLVLTLLIAPSLVRAEDIVGYETEGEADAGGSDPRVAALDEAFARAAQAAVQELVEPEVRKTSRTPIDKEIVGRARLWVTNFKVTKDETADGRRQLTVMVRVDKDKMRARLAELNIAAKPVGDVPPNAKSVAIVLRVTTPSGTHATYGAGAEKDVPGLAALSQALRGAAMAPKRAPASGPAAKPGGELPLEDDEADALAAEAKADNVALASVVVGEPAPVRGLPTPGVLVTAHVRVIPRGGKALGSGTAMVAARGTEASVVNAAIERALAAAASDVLPPAKAALDPAKTFSGDDTPIRGDGVVLVRLSPKTPWGLVVAEQKYLANAKGVQKAVIRRLSPGGWVIGVSTAESIDRIAQIARKAPSSDTTAKVKVAGDVVELALGAP